MSTPRPRVRTWRRTLRALALEGRARAARHGPDERARNLAGPGIPGGDTGGAAHAISGADGVLQLSPGPHATALALDRGPLAPPVLLRPRQGRLGDCWLMAPMLALHETAPERLRALIGEETDGIVTVRLPGLEEPLRVDRRFPVDARGVFQYGRRDGANPGWVGVLEKAIAGHIAGDYAFLQRGMARYGFALLLGERVRTNLRLPDAGQVLAWLAEGRALCASTHPLSPRVPSAAGLLPPNHVFAVVGADATSGHLHLRNPVRPAELLVLDARSFRRGFLSVDVTAPLR
ncbi:C2 family cysteine protease [Brachybacterium sp. GU-2]|uniref:C2 family cysteine protease n=1 Tax=Brachybacterium sp. GU-2 TaxID=3069708 RepID=UPI00280B03DB|nr:C2 family cysteine protease [Brachybacterium sp. GU-2]WME21595.1 C2 family cysteine protease [Brachybacterium sp. GU-2]